MSDPVRFEMPPPAPRPDRAPAWPLVIADFENAGALDRWARLVIDDMRARDALGREKYGTPLTGGNGRDLLLDAYHEKLDALVYLRAWLDDQDTSEIKEAERARVKRINTIRDLYCRELLAIWDLRRTLDLGVLPEDRG